MRGKQKILAVRVWVWAMTTAAVAIPVSGASIVPVRAPDVDQVREVLREFSVRQVLMIEVDQAYLFAALVLTSGEIYDLRRQPLAIEQVH